LAVSTGIPYTTSRILKSEYSETKPGDNMEDNKLNKTTGATINTGTKTNFFISKQF
jgi:hypothetical protein